MFIARIKYSRRAVPTETEFKTAAEAQDYGEQKYNNNPLVRWFEVDTKKKYK